MTEVDVDDWLNFHKSLTTERDSWSLDRNIQYYKRPGETPKDEFEYWDAFNGPNSFCG